MVYIYKHTNQSNGKAYVGASRDPHARWRTHCSDARKGSDLYFHRAIRKYGPESFSMCILEEIEYVQVNEREPFWIARFQTQDREHGYNIANGGHGHFAPMPEEMRRRISVKTKQAMQRSEVRARYEAAIAKIDRVEFRRKVAEGTKKAMQRPEVKEKIAENVRSGRYNGAQKLRGRKRSEETRRRCAEASRLAWQDPEKRARMLDAQRKARAKKMELAKCVDRN